MPLSTCPDLEIPTLSSLGDDLLTTTHTQKRLALARPFLGVAAYAVAACAGQWWLTPFLVFLIFVAVVTVTHDVVHGSLGLSPRQTEWASSRWGPSSWRVDMPTEPPTCVTTAYSRTPMTRRATPPA